MAVLNFCLGFLGFCWATQQGNRYFVPSNRLSVERSGSYNGMINDSNLFVDAML